MTCVRVGRVRRREEVREKEVAAGRQEEATYGRPRVLLRLRVSVAGSDGCGWLGSGSDGDGGE
jgi:hypothetical protein